MLFLLEDVVVYDPDLGRKSRLVILFTVTESFLFTCTLVKRLDRPVLCMESHALLNNFLFEK